MKSNTDNIQISSNYGNLIVPRGAVEHPIIRNRAFSLKELSRIQIRKTEITFEEISQLECPESLKTFLQEYHIQE